DRDFHRRLDRLRVGADDLAACPCAGTARPRRWRFVADRADHHRRSAVAARTTGGAGSDLDHVHERQHPRPGPRRITDRSATLVADILDQSAARRRRPGDERARSATTAAQRTSASTRYDRRRLDGRRGAVADAGARLGWHALSMDFLAYSRFAGGIGRAL